MPRLVAFLRGMNVGGHRLPMTSLRGYFEALKFKKVETFIASGNVIFDAPAGDFTALEGRIEKYLARELGYAAPTFVRTLPGVASVVAHRAFPKTTAEDSLYVYFLKTAPDAALKKSVAELESDVDKFGLHGRELYWRCRGKISEVSTAWPGLEKLMRSAVATSRNVTMLRKLLAQYGEILAVEEQVR